MIKVVAQSLDTSVDDDEGLSSVFIKWGAAGQYVDLTREEDGEKVYCEFFDQANGAEFDSIKFNYSNKTLALDVAPPETFVRGQQEHRAEIDLNRVQLSEREFLDCLQHLFRSRRVRGR